MSGEQEHRCAKCGFEWEDFEAFGNCPNCRGVRGTPKWEEMNASLRSTPIWNRDLHGNSFAKSECGEIVLEARVILGGNNWWTPYVIKSRLGRPRKRGPGRIASTILEHVGRAQTKTRDEAITWCEAEWRKLANAPYDGDGSPAFKSASSASSEARKITLLR